MSTLDPTARKVMLAAAREYALRDGDSSELLNHRAMLLVSFMAGIFSGDVELANALRGVVGLPQMPEDLPVIEVDIDAIHRRRA